MNTKKLRQHKKSLKRTSWVLKSNPVVAMGLALPFAIVPTVNLKAAVSISLFVATAAFCMAILAVLIKDSLKPIFKTPLLAVVSMLGVLCFAKYLNLPQAILDTLGLYLPLAAVNSLAWELSTKVEKKTVPQALLLAVQMTLGFALTACSVGAVREILAFKTIWGVSFALYPIKLSALTLPCFGFIILGFGAAFFRSFDRTISRLIFRSENRATTGMEVRSDA